MRAISLFLAATALLSTAGLAQAETAAIEASRATAQQMAEVSGDYQLSDGRRVEVFVADYRLFARIGQGQRKEILPAGPNRFATRDGKIAIQFGPDLNTDTIVLAHERGIAPAPDTIRLASNARIGRGGAD